MADEPTQADTTPSTDEEHDSRRSRSALATLGLLIAAAIIALLILTQCSAKVPDVLGLSQNAAIAKLHDAGYAIGTISHVTDRKRTPGTVSEQAPAAGTSAKKGSAVDLLIARDNRIVIVPDVVGMRIGVATASLQKADLGIAETDVYSDTVPAGEVVAQDPHAGSRAPAGFRVDVTVSFGPAPAGATSQSGSTLLTDSGDGSTGDGSTGSDVVNVFTRAYPGATTWSSGGDVYVRLTPGGASRRVTSGSAWDTVPRMSPAGTYVVFLRASGSGRNPTQVGIVNLTTMSPHILKLPISTRRPAKDVWYGTPVFAPKEGSTALSSVWVVIPQYMTPKPDPDARLLVCNVPYESSWASWNIAFFPTNGLTLSASPKASCVRVRVGSGRGSYDADFDCYTGWYTER